MTRVELVDQLAWAELVDQAAKGKQKTSTGAKAELEITTAVQVEQKSLSLRSIAPPKKCLGGSGIDMSTVKEDLLSWRASSTNSQKVPEDHE